MSGGVSECAIDWVRGDKYAGVTAYAGSRLKGRIEKLAEARPDDVQILNRNQDGSIYAHVPVAWVKISPPRKVSEEQRQAAREKFMRYRQGLQGQNAELEESDEDIEEDREDFDED